MSERIVLTPSEALRLVTRTLVRDGRLPAGVDCTVTIGGVDAARVFREGAPQIVIEWGEGRRVPDYWPGAENVVPLRRGTR